MEVGGGGDQAKLYSCDICGKSYTWSTSLAHHKRNVHGRDAGNCQCSFCDYIATNKVNLKAHMYNKHNYRRRPPCTESSDHSPY